MKQSSMAATAAGIAAASVAVGTAAYFANTHSKKGRRRAMQRKAGKAMRHMGSTMSNVVDQVASNLLG